MGEVTDEISLQQNAYDRYIKQANSVGLSSDWVKKVKNGKVDISTITDEDLADKIKEYQDWYEKALDCKNAIDELNESLAELYQQAFDNVATKFDGILGTIEHQSSMLEEYINQSEQKGYITSVKYYNALMKNEQKNIKQLEKEKSEMLFALQDAMNSGTITKNSESWHEMVNQIDEVTLAIEEANTAMIEYGNSIRDIQWDIFDLLQEKISYITQEADFLISLMENDKLYDDRGQLTNEGMSTMGLHGVNYNVYMAQADKYAQEMQKINKKLANDPYNQDLAERRQELLELQQEMILAAEDEKEAIRDMVSEGIELELDALQDLIDKYNDAMDAQKDLYDYQKKVKDQTSEIASLQKELSAYAGDASEETKAKVQQLQVSLADAQEDLAETQYDKYVTDQKKLLDELYNEYESILNQRLDNIDTLMTDMIEEINNSSLAISQTLNETANNVGYTLTTEMSNIWKSSDGVNGILITYGDKFDTALTSVNSVLNTISVNIQNMITQLNKTADTNVTAAKENSASNSKQAQTTKKDTSKPKTNTSTANTIKVGSKINAKGAKIYADSNGGGASTQYFASDPIYTVLGENNGYYKVRWYKTSSGVTGWFKKSDVKAYKTGVQNLNRDQWAWTQEDGIPETIIRPSDGAILTPLKRGDSVLNGEATANLFDMMTDPSKFIRKNLFDKNSVGDSSNVNNTTNTTSVNLENVNLNLPNVRNYEDFMNQMVRDKRFESLVRDVSTNRVFGGSSLKKYRNQWKQ